MIRKILTTYAERLDEYLSRFHRRPEGLATVGLIGNATEESPNKMVVSLLNVERETAGGIAAPVQRTPEGYVRTQPPLLLNLNVMLAAVFDERQYAESLSVLSDTLRFIQSVPKFEVDGTDYTIEIVSVTTQDLNNVWTLLGGQYYPSVVCKIRRLTIDSGEIGTGGTTADKPIIECDMESYSILYRICAVHDYFDGKPCPSLQCHLTPHGEELAHRRGLLLRQTAVGEWTLLSDNLPAEDDVLTLDLFLTDPAFMLYTAWQGFQPSAAYCLELPAAEEETEAATAIRPTDKKRGIGRGFCTVTLRMTKELLEAAEAGKPMQATLRFRAPSLQWEYVFIPRGETDIPSGRMALEDAAGKVEFSAFKEYEAYGHAAIRTASKSRIPMRRGYGCKLRLTAQDEGRQKRILLRQVPPPEPGRFADVGKGILRQVCYY